MSEKNICVKCGSEGTVGDKFCEHCGGKLRLEKAPPPQADKKKDEVMVVKSDDSSGASGGWSASRAWTIFIILVWVAAFFLRFYDLGNKPLHHDESIHAEGSYKFFQHFDYKYKPGYHGPLLYYLTAASYFLFGDSDASCRFPAAVFGLMLVGLGFMFRDFLGAAGRTAFVLFLLISPTLLYMSRFERMDIFVAFFTLSMIYTAMRYAQSGADKYLVLCALSLSLSFATKEITYINVAVLASFVVLKFIWDWLSVAEPRAFFNSYWQPLVADLRDWKNTLPLGLSIFFVAFYSAFVPVGDAVGKGAFIVIYFAFLLYLINAYWVPLVEGERNKRLFNYVLLGGGTAAFLLSTIQRIVDTGTLPRQHFYAWGGTSVWMALLFLLVVFIVLAAAILSLAFYLRSVRKANLCLVIVMAVITPLFTTFATNLGGFTGGTLDSFAYWLGQHGVARGSQPAWYYLMLLPANELMPLLLSFFAAIYLGIFHRKPLTYFAIWWSVLSLVIYSLAGERMPWLTIHMSLPLIFLVSLYIGTVWRRLMHSWGHLVVIALAFCLLPLYFRTAIGLSFHHPADPVEPMVYVQTGYDSIDVATIIREISQIETGSTDMHMTIESTCSWPFAWYLRDYPHKAHPDWIQPGEKNPVVLTGIDFKNKNGMVRDEYNKSILEQDYVSRQFRLRVWWAPGRDRHRHDLAGVNVRENMLPRLGYWWRHRDLLYDFLVHRKIWNPAMTQEKDENGNMVEKYDRWADAFNMRLWIRKDVMEKLREFPMVLERDKRYR